MTPDPTSSSRATPSHQPEIESAILDVTKRYDFGADLERYAEQSFFSYHPQNQAFLATLDHYFTEIGVSLPEKINAMDFGCGHAPYLPSLVSFLSKFEQEQGASRAIEHFVLWEGNDECRIPYQCGEISFHLRGSFVKEPNDMIQDFTDLSGGPDHLQFDFVSLFDLGPSPSFSCFGEDITNAEGNYFEVPGLALSKVMRPGGVLVMTVSEGGQDKQTALEQMEDYGFSVLVNEKNRFSKSLEGMGNGYPDIIIGKLRELE